MKYWYASFNQISKSSMDALNKAGCNQIFKEVAKCSYSLHHMIKTANDLTHKF